MQWTAVDPEPGLTGAEVAARLSQGRVNVATTVTSRSLWTIVRDNVFTRFNALLGAMFVLVLLTGSYADGLFGLALILNSAFGIAQEWYAKRKLDSLAVLHAPTAEVVRDGRRQTIGVEQIVADDVVCLARGDQIPADGPLLAADNLEVDESNLTGESDAVVKVAGQSVFSGTAVVAGFGWFRAEVVGDQAVAHRLAREAKAFRRAYSEVQASTNRLLRWITWVVLAMFPVALLAQYRGFDIDTSQDIVSNWRALILKSVGGLVALVPEGLVLLTTLAFLLAALQLTRQQALVQELPAVEGLARVDLICLDKTGTLTTGDIAFERCQALAGWDEPALRAILGALVHEPEPNPTAAAIGRAMADPGWTPVRRAAFSSARKWSGADLGSRGAWVLGAPEILLDPGTDAALLDRLDHLAAEGHRVVLVGRVATLAGEGEPPGQVTPAGWVELSEVIRPDAAATLAYFRRQEVDVKIISGDHPVTVAAVAAQVGLELPVGAVVDARQLPDDPDELADLVSQIVVFGRVTPDQKKALIEAFQSRGHTVAMTGDGVNDVLALKAADVGIAMGNGAPATKAVAQLVLLDSRFSHLPKVLAEGRRLIGNVERVAALFVAKNVMAACLISATAILGASFPFLPRHITMLSILTIGLPAMFLALGANRRKYVPGFLARVLRLALPTGLAAGLAAFLGFALGQGNDIQKSTLALMALFIVNFWLLGVLARPWNWWKALVVGGCAAAAVLAFTLPVPRDFLQLQLPAGEWWLVGLIGGVGAAIVEVSYHLARSWSWWRPVPAVAEPSDSADPVEPAELFGPSATAAPGTAAGRANGDRPA